MQPAADAPIARRRTAPPELLQSLGDRFQERCSTGPAVRHQHGRDDSPYDTTPPDCVVFPTNSAEVAEVVRMCARHRVPVIAYGAGTSIEGHIMAVEGGVTVDLSRMNRVIAVNGEDLTASVEAGVTRKQLNAEIEDTGLFFPVDPGADATLGGMAATRASGSNAVRYGTMRENVLGLRVVTADGEVIRTALREEVLGWVRPHEDLRGERRDARYHHRGHGPALPPTRGRVGRGLPLPGRRGRGQHGHPDDPTGRPDRARRAARRADRHRGQSV